MTNNEQDPQPSSPNKPLLYLSLIAVLFGIFAAAFFIKDALVKSPFDRVPLPVFLGILLAVVALVVGINTLNKQKDVEDDSKSTSSWRDSQLVQFIKKNGRYIAFVVSILFMFFVLIRLPQMSPDDDYSDLFWMWLLSTSLYLWAVAPQYVFSWDVPAWWRRNRQLIWTLGGILFIAFILRVWRLSSLPFSLGGDEASQGLESVRVLDGVLRNPFTTGWLGVPTMSFFFNSWTIDLFGRTAFALRIPWVVVGTLTVLIVFFLVKRLMGIRLAVATAVILSVYHYHIHYSRLGSNQIADPFFIALALLFLYRALDRENNLDWALTGAVSAVALYFYAGARLTPIVIVVVLGYLFVRQPKQFFPKYGRGILIAVGAFLLVGAPMIQYAFRFPNDFNARLNQVGIFHSGWFEMALEVEGTGPIPILWDQFLRAVLAFNYYPDRTVWYGLREPLLSPLFGVLFWVGMGYSMIRLFGRGSNPRYAPMVAWWWGGMLLGGFLTESPPSSQRIITLSVPVSFFLAVAMWQIIRLTFGVLTNKNYPAWVANTALAVGVILFGASSIHLYFVEYLPMRIYGGTNAELATMVIPQLEPLQQDHEIYFVGAPHMYWGFAPLPFLLAEASAQDIREPIVSHDDVKAIEVIPDKGAVFVFHNRRVEEAEQIKTVYPGGEFIEVYSPVDNRLLAALYVLGTTTR